MTPELLAGQLAGQSPDGQADYLDDVVGRLPTTLRDALLRRWLPPLCRSLDGERVILADDQSLVAYLIPVKPLTREEAAQIKLPRIESKTNADAVTAGV